MVRGENKKDIWLKLTDPISGNVLPQSTFIRITTQFLYIDRELDFIEETYEKL